MKRRIWFLAVLTAVILIAACITTVVCAREFTAEVYYLNGSVGDVTVTGTRCDIENGHVELKDVAIEDGIVRATFVPKSVGYESFRFCTETDHPEDNGDVELRFFAGPFGTIFAFLPLIDFQGSVYVICLMLLNIFAIAAVLLFSFADMVRKADFGYRMVACGGIGLFCLHYFIACMIIFIGSFMTGYSFGFGNFLHELADSGGKFSRSIELIMFVFCAALIISNLSLIRHEGFRLHNLLGVVLGVLWVVGTVINRFFYSRSFVDLTDVYSGLSNGLAVVISYFECMLISTSASAFFASRSQPPFDRDYVIILGCSIRSDGTLTPILQGRVDAAVSFAEKQLRETGKRLKYVPSGGQGSDEVISEGEAMKRYLIDCGVDGQDILPETKSVNTFENFKCSGEIIESDGAGEYRAAFATTNYHVFRGYILANKLGMRHMRGIAAKTKWYFFPNAFLRELVGLIVDKWKLHAIVIVLIILAFTAIHYSI